MKLHEPFMITSRLLPGLKIGDGTLSMRPAGYDHCGREVWRWYLDIPSGEFSEADLSSGCNQVGGGLQAMTGALLSFLGAAVESYRYDGMEGENSDLFPEPVLEWASQFEDEISMLQVELEEGGVLVEE